MKGKKQKKAPMKKLVNVKQVATIAKRELRKTLEVKTLVRPTESQELRFTSSTFPSPITFVLSPQLIRGTANHQLVGNNIKLKRVTFKYIITAADNSTSLDDIPPCFVTVIVCRLKNGYYSPTAVEYQRLKQANTLNIPISSDDLTTLLLPYNDDTWKIHKTITHKVGHAANIREFTTFSTFQPVFNNNDFRYEVTKTLDVTKYFNKVIKYEDGSSDPVNGSLYILMYLTPVDETNTAYPFFPRVAAVQHFEYYDA